MNNFTQKYRYHEQSYTLEELGHIAEEKSGITLQRLKRRLYAGWTPEDAVETPSRGKCQTKTPRYLYQGNELTLQELSEIVGKSAKDIRKELAEGKTLEEAIKTTYPKYIYFDRHINGVSPEMQPQLNRTYHTLNGYWPLGQSMDTWSRRYCIILLDNGKKLLVYEEEFKAVTDPKIIARLDEMVAITWAYSHGNTDLL